MPVRTTPTVECEGSTCSDYMLAQLLQYEYDREHDRQVMAEEAHFNKHNKGTGHYTQMPGHFFLITMEEVFS